MTLRQLAFVAVGVLILIGDTCALQSFHNEGSKGFGPDGFADTLDLFAPVPPTHPRETVLHDPPGNSVPLNMTDKVQTGFGGFAQGLTHSWKDLVGNGTTLGVYCPGGNSYDYQFRYLKERGYNISFVVEPFDNEHNPLDIVYNATFWDELKDNVDQQFNFTWVDLVSSVVLSDEAPASSYHWMSFDEEEWSADVVKWNDTYHSETGNWFKRRSEMTSTEFWVFQDWMGNRTATAFNMLYDYVKQERPDIEAGWSLLGDIGLAPDLIKTDWRGGIGV